MADKNSRLKYHVGRFTITDNKTALSVSAVVEVDGTDVRGAAWFSFDAPWSEIRIHSNGL